METDGIESGKKQSLLVTIAVVFIAAFLLVWVFVSYRQSSQVEIPTYTAEEVSRALDKVSAPSAVEVPTSVNPIKQVLPDENPVDKANPFNKVYKNPFDE